MADSLSEILSGKAQKSNEPPEFPIIRAFIIKEYKITPKLSLSNKNIIIRVPSAAIAGSLRLSLHQLKKECNTDKRLYLRIG